VAEEDAAAEAAADAPALAGGGGCRVSDRCARPGRGAATGGGGGFTGESVRSTAIAVPALVDERAGAAARAGVGRGFAVVSAASSKKSSSSIGTGAIRAAAGGISSFEDVAATVAELPRLETADAGGCAAVLGRLR